MSFIEELNDDGNQSFLNNSSLASSQKMYECESD